jgi:hypothetical protein
VPILMIALFALAVFGLIGVLLAGAVVLETKKVNAANSSTQPVEPANKPAA